MRIRVPDAAWAHLPQVLRFPAGRSMAAVLERCTMEQFHQLLTDEGYDSPVRSLYFFWVDRFILEHQELNRELMSKLARGMVDRKFIHDCEIYDFPEDDFLLVCKFSLNLYEVVFFLPSSSGYLAGNKYFMRIKGKIDLVSLRQLFKVFRVKLWN
jgi:hypothetical protein